MTTLFWLVFSFLMVLAAVCACTPADRFVNKFFFAVGIYAMGGFALFAATAFILPMIGINVFM